MTAAEQQLVLRLAAQEPVELLALLARSLAPMLPAAPAVPSPAPSPERAAGDDPFLISEDEFSYRARFMSYEEQQILRCRVNAARLHKAGHLDHARRQRMRADRLEAKLHTQAA